MTGHFRQTAATGHTVQFRPVCLALEGDPMARSTLSGATIDAGVIERIERSVPGARAEIEALGARIVGDQKPERPPSFGWRPNPRAVVRAAVTWAAAQYGDDSVAAGVAVHIVADHGYALPSRNAYELVRAVRTRRRGAA